MIIRSPSIHVYSFSAFSCHSPILPVHRSSILLSARDLFVLMYLNPSKHFRSFANSSRCFFIFSSFIFNSYGGSPKTRLPSLSYQFIHSCFPNSTGGSLKTFSRLRYISLNLFYENKLYAIRLLVINLIGEGYA